MEIDENEIVFFPKGLPAFEDIREFSLISFPDNSVYFCLQSIKHPEIAFLLIRPWDFFPGYDIVIPQEDLKELLIEEREQVEVYNIVTIPYNPWEMTANLLAPVVINKTNRQGKQIILEQSEYGTKHLLFKKEAV